VIIRLKKVSDNENKWVDELGVKSARGVLAYMKNEPQIGHQFVAFHAENNDNAMLITSLVKQITYDGGENWTIKTCNSTYEIEAVRE
jgi:hypothetical protein